MNIGLKDKKLLYWLDQNSRMVNKQLGKKVGLTEQAISYKIKKLKKTGVIKKFVTFINTLSLGYQHYKLFIKLHKTTEEIEDKLIEDLTNNHNIRWVVSTSGRYDIGFSILAKTALGFSEIFQKIESKWGEHFIEKNIVLNIKSPGFTRDWLVGKKESKKLDYKSSSEVQKTDQIDKKILKAISQEARKNVVDIAKEINSTVDVVKYRLKRLKAKNIINGFTIEIDLEKLNHEYYSVFFSTHNLTKEIEYKILTFAKLNPNILFFVRVIGSYDIQIELEVKNHEELNKILKKFRNQFPEHIRNFEVLRILKEYKYDFYPF
jgi:DNA-binding Lrp family transcriptional regulator